MKQKLLRKVDKLNKGKGNNSKRDLLLAAKKDLEAIGTSFQASTKETIDPNDIVFASKEDMMKSNAVEKDETTD